MYGGGKVRRKTRIKLMFFVTVILTITAILCIMDIKDELYLMVMNKTDIFQPEIIIDAGHGGADGGAVSSNGVYLSALICNIWSCMRPLASPARLK